MAPTSMRLLTAPGLLRGLLVIAWLAACPFPKPAVAELLAAKLDAKLVASFSSPPGAGLGTAVAASGNTLVAGMAADGTLGPSAGALYVYERNAPGAPWTIRARLLDSNGGPSQLMGHAVAIDGDTIVAGNPAGDEALVYVRPAGGWSGVLTEAARLVAAVPVATDFFARSVAIEGDTVVIGAPGETTHTGNGSVYVYEKPGSGWAGTLTEDGRLLASGGASHHFFGRWVDISGSQIAVGAPMRDPFAFGDPPIEVGNGAVYVFEEPVGGWSGTLFQDATLTASDGALGHALGRTVAIASGAVFAGATHATGNVADSGAVYVFLEPGGGWSGGKTEDAKLWATDVSATDALGGSLAAFGDLVAAGAPGDFLGVLLGADAVFLFEEPAGGWSGSQTETSGVAASDLILGDSFGSSVALEEDSLAIGSAVAENGNPTEGAIYTLEKPAGGWAFASQEDYELMEALPDYADFDAFGGSVAVSGNVAVVGSANAPVGGLETGAAYVFERFGAGWRAGVKLVPSDGGMDDFFGASVAIDGDTIVVGAERNDHGGISDRGAAYVFVRTQSLDWWQGTVTEDAKLIAFGPAIDDELGTSVSVSGDTIVIGSPGDDDGGSDSGSALVYVEPGGGWSGTPIETAKLRASDGAADDALGGSVAIDGSVISVGAPGDDHVATDAGSAYVFVEPGGGWSGTLFETAKLTASDAATGDAFGFVDIEGDTIGVGAPFGDGIVADSGAAYVFVEPGGGWAGALGEDAKLRASNGAVNDFFGFELAVSTGRVGVGAPLGAGTAYLFEAPGGGWSGSLSEDLELTPIDPPSSFFGSVGLDANHLVIGASGDDDVGSFAGSAYAYTLPEPGSVPGLLAGWMLIHLLRRLRH